MKREGKVDQGKGIGDFGRVWRYFGGLEKGYWKDEKEIRKWR